MDISNSISYISDQLDCSSLSANTLVIDDDTEFQGENLCIKTKNLVIVKSTNRKKKTITMTGQKPKLELVGDHVEVTFAENLCIILNSRNLSPFKKNSILLEEFFIYYRDKKSNLLEVAKVMLSVDLSYTEKLNNGIKIIKSRTSLYLTISEKNLSISNQGKAHIPEINEKLVNILPYIPSIFELYFLSDFKIQDDRNEINIKKYLLCNYICLIKYCKSPKLESYVQDKKLIYEISQKATESYNFISDILNSQKIKLSFSAKKLLDWMKTNKLPRDSKFFTLFYFLLLNKVDKLLIDMQLKGTQIGYKKPEDDSEYYSKIISTCVMTEYQFITRKNNIMWVKLNFIKNKLIIHSDMKQVIDIKGWDNPSQTNIENILERIELLKTSISDKESFTITIKISYELYNDKNKLDLAIQDVLLLFGTDINFSRILIKPGKESFKNMLEDDKRSYGMQVQGIEFKISIYFNQYTLQSKLIPINEVINSLDLGGCPVHLILNYLARPLRLCSRLSAINKRVLLISNWDQKSRIVQEILIIDKDIEICINELVIETRAILICNMGDSKSDTSKVSLTIKSKAPILRIKDSVKAIINKENLSIIFKPEYPFPSLALMDQDKRNLKNSYIVECLDLNEDYSLYLIAYFDYQFGTMNIAEPLDLKVNNIDLQLRLYFTKKKISIIFLC